MALSFRLSRGVLGTIAPPIPTAYGWAAQYIPTSRRPLLDMSQGVPGIPPPKFLQEALGKASSSPKSFGYCPADGEPGLRKALSEEMKNIYGNADLSPEDIALTAGCNMAFVATIMSLADAGDEVILPVPWYFNHQMDLTLLGIKPVPLSTWPRDGFLPSTDRCKALITPKTKAIALVTPNNPTGAIYTNDLLNSFLELAQERKIALIIDETYRDFLLDGAPHTLFNSSSWRANLVSLYSFSKSYCLPGHRLGAIVASPVLITKIKTVLDCLQICPPRPMQQALTPLLFDMRPFIRDTATLVASRHALFHKSLPKRWKVGSQGGYYAFVRHPFLGISSLDVCKRLATEIGVVTLPSTFFCDESDAKGDSGRWMRFSVANVNDEKVQKVCERLAESELVFGWKLDED